MSLKSPDTFEQNLAKISHNETPEIKANGTAAHNVVHPSFQQEPAPASRVQRTDQIYQTLREMMRNGQLKLGDRLPTEEKLCQHFNVSRTTLREAIQMLRCDGSLSVAPGRGSYVQQLNKSRLMENFALYSHFQKTNPVYVLHLLALNLHAYMPKICRANTQDRRQVFDNLINRHDSPKSAAQKESLWLQAMAKLTENPMLVMLAEWLTTVNESVRVQQLENPEELMRGIQCQIRINTAITDGEIEVAQRQLLGLLRVKDVPDSTVLVS